MAESPVTPPRVRSPRIELRIDRELVERCVKADSGHCMIAEAIREQVPGASYITVDIQTVRWSDRKKGVRYAYLTPTSAQRKLIRFDQGDEELESFTVRLTHAQVAHI